MGGGGVIPTGNIMGLMMAAWGLEKGLRGIVMLCSPATRLIMAGRNLPGKDGSTELICT